MADSTHKTLIISGHPDLENSYTNRVILDELQTALDGVSVRRLDRLYPDYRIDVAAEQAALVEADTIVLQFPFYWYAAPALLKKWLDDVFAFDFAYGPNGDKLKGKTFFLSFTVGGPEESYDPLGYNHFTIEQLIRPLQQTAYLAGVDYQPPIFTHRMVYIPGVYNTQEAVESRARDHARRLIARITAATGSVEARIGKFVADWFAQFDQLSEDESYFTDRLSETVNWVMPDGTYHGHRGFRDWYALARRTFKPGCRHQVEQIENRRTKTGYEVALRIRLIAESFDDSDFSGAPVNMLVNETWQVEPTDSTGFKICDYQVRMLS